MTNFHVFSPAEESIEEPVVREISYDDVFSAIRSGFNDFMDKPSHYAFLVLIYPIMGFALVAWASGGNSMQLVYPLLTGFALIGPIAAIGLYEISRRREKGMDTAWKHARAVWRSPAMPSIAAVGAMLLVLFLLWLFTAQAIYGRYYGTDAPDTVLGFLKDVISTSRGWGLILVGNFAGFIFALVALCTSAVAFPLMLDRDVGALEAVKTSAKVVAASPGPMLLWGMIIAGALFWGALPFLAGLIIVLPVLGHSTWHIYRKAVVDPKG
jgi:uncharacterized membrane protein